MKIQKFEELVCWQKGRDIAVVLYKLFKTNNDFGFREQIQRAAISISNKIAEGLERKSNKEVKHFLYIAKGSSGEVRSMLYIALSLGYISQSDFEDLNNKSFEISKIISGLIKTL